MLWLSSLALLLLSSLLTFARRRYDLLYVEPCSRGNCSLPPKFSPLANSALPAQVEGVRQFASLGIGPDQLVMAMPWYGYDVACADTDKLKDQGFCDMRHPWPETPWIHGSLDPMCKSSKRSGPATVMCAQQVPIEAILQRMKTSKTSGWKYDVASVSAFYEFHGDGPPGTINSGRHQIWFDDASTLGVKCRWCSANGIRGVGMWTATHVSYPSEIASEMWGAIKLFTKS